MVLQLAMKTRISRDVGMLRHVIFVGFVFCCMSCVTCPDDVAAIHIICCDTVVVCRMKTKTMGAVFGLQWCMST